MVRKVELDEKRHALGILQRLDAMKRGQRRCDFVVSVDGDEFHTHGNILCAGSDYFNAMLTHDTKESQLGKVEMMGVDSECIRVCIDYIYTGNADVPEGKIEHLMHAARLMQLDDLFEGLVTVIENDLDINTYYKTKEISERYGLENLLTKCKEFTDKNIRLISMQPGFLDEPRKFVDDVISSENLLVTEEEKLIVSLRWTRHDPDRTEFLLDFVNAIDLNEVSISYRRYLLENEYLVANDPQLFRAFSISIMDSVRIQSENKEDFCSNERVIIFDRKSDRLQHFNIENNKMKTFHNENIKRFLTFSAVFWHPHIYVFSADKSVYRLRVQDENTKWEEMKSMIEDHGEYPPVVSNNSCMYVMGGSHGCCSASAERYFPSENKWVRLANMPSANENATLVSVDEHIYSAGGSRDGRCLDTFSRFTPSKSEWVDLPAMTRRKHCCIAVVANRKLYIVGGHDGEKSITEVDRFDIVTSQWTSLTPMIEPRHLTDAFYINRMIYVFGGHDGKMRKLIEKYDIEKDVWESVNIEPPEPIILKSVAI